LPKSPVQLGRDGTITNANLEATTTDGVIIPLGSVLSVALVSDAYRRDGSVAPWTVSLASSTTPTAAAILVPSPPPPGMTCPARATCDSYRGVARGRAELELEGPSGLICNREHQECVAVAAALGRVAVEVQ
jgi:hypothetical protein